jgi:hypothetical protein
MYFSILIAAIRQHRNMFLLISFGFVIMYYSSLLLLTMLRFGEIPNYLEVYDIIGIYAGILQGTPSLSDALMIMKDEAWIETGYKNPDYYGVATWSYMLIPPKMVLVFLLGLLLGVFSVLLTSRRRACAQKTDRKVMAAAGLGSSLVCMTSATLTWVVCCATPSWVVALAMLGMNASLALLLEPLGQVMMALGLGIMLMIIVLQLRQLAAHGFTGESLRH